MDKWAFGLVDEWQLGVAGACFFGSAGTECWRQIKVYSDRPHRRYGIKRERSCNRLADSP